MTLMIHEWWDESPFPQGIPGAPHKCANWDKLTTWFQDNSFDIFKPGMMRHPVTGLEPPWGVALKGEDPSKVH
ncbi:MAG: hypothetical protein MMC33_006528 [Icmadophila ericetorum]|nr:hypothetical protein [Icmadophila ericetorum]